MKWKQLMRRIHTHRAYSMLLLSYIVFLVISMMFAGVGYARLYNTTRRHMEEQVSSQLQQAAFITDGYVKTIRQSVFSLAMSPHTQAFAYTRSPMNTDDYYRLAQTVKEINGVFTANANLSSLCVYIRGIDSIVTPTTRLSTRDYYEQYLQFKELSEGEWRDCLDGSGYFTVLPVQTLSRTGQKVILFSSSLPIASTSHGAVVGSMDVALIGNIFFSGGFMDQGGICIEAGGVVCTLDGPGASGVWMLDDDVQFVRDDGQKTFVVSVQGESGWRYHCALPYSVHTSGLIATRNFILLMILMELLGGLLISLVLVRANYRPLRRLVEKITHTARDSAEDEYDSILSAATSIVLENSELNGRLRRQQPLIRASLIRRVLDGDSNLDEALLAEYSVELSHGAFTVLLISPVKNASGETRAVLNYSLIDILESVLNNKVTCYAVEYLSDTIALLLCADEAAIGPAVSDMLEYFDASLGLLPAVGMGRVVHGATDISRSCSEAQEALSYALAWNKTGLTAYEGLSITPQHGVPLHQQVQLLTQHLRAGDGDKARALIVGLFHDVYGLPLIHMRIMAYDVIAVFLRLLAEWNAPSQAQENVERIGAVLVRSVEPEALCSQLCELAEQVAGCASQVKDENDYGIGNKAIAIIQERFRDDTLSLTMLAQELQLNASYLSHVFRQQTGSTFVDFLNRTRLDHACWLLKSTTDSIQSISEQCGYTSAGYFNRLFKKQFGQTPSQFRNGADSKKTL